MHAIHWFGAQMGVLHICRLKKWSGMFVWAKDIRRCGAAAGAQQRALHCLFEHV
jgi:hypothetical protein